MHSHEQTLAQELLTKNIISNNQLQTCLQYQTKWQKKNKYFPISYWLINLKYITSEQLEHIEKNLPTNNQAVNINFQPGQIFRHYRIDSQLGAGGMGVVYKAYDTNLQRHVALKFILSLDISKEETQILLKEASITAQLSHPNIVKIFELGSTPQPYFAMEYIKGSTFDSLLQKKKTSYHTIAKVISKIASALHKAHKNKIIHRDIKPSNIMITTTNEPKLMDFGLAKFTDIQNTLSHTGRVVGTAYYMSPEQANGEKVTDASDLYSLGATLYEALCKRPPFQGENYVKIAHRIFNEEPIAPTKLNPDIPRELEAICLKCIEKNPEKRYKNCKELQIDLKNYLHNRPIIATSPNIWTYSKKFALRHKFSVVLVLFVIVSILYSSFFSYREWQKTEKQKRIVQKQKEYQEQEAWRVKKEMALITLAKAKRFAGSGHWQKCGIYAGKALEFVKLLPVKQVSSIQKSAQALVAHALLRNGVVWRTDNLFTSQLQQKFATYSPSGKYIISANDMVAKIWNAKTGEQLHILETYPTAITDIKITAKEILATSYDDGTILLWQCVNGQQIMTLKHTHSISGIAFYHSNLLSSSSDGKILLWDLQSKKKKLICQVKEEIEAFAISPNVKTIAFATRQNNKRFFYVWEMGKNKPNYRIKIKQHVKSLLFTKNSRAIISAHTPKLHTPKNKNNSIKIWDTTTGQKLQEFFGHAANAPSIAITDNTLVSSSFNGTLLHHLKSGKLIKQWPQNSGSISISPDKKTIASCNNRIVFTDINSGKTLHPLQSHTQMIPSITFSPDGTLIASCSYDKTIKIWKANNGKLIQSFSTPNATCFQIKFSPDGKMLATGDSSGKITLRTITGKVIRSFQEPGIMLNKNGFVRGISFSPDGKKIASTTSSDRGFIWEISSGKQLKIIPRKNNFSMNNVLWSTDEKWLAYSYENQVLLWNPITGKKKHTLVHKNNPHALSFTQNSQILATGSANNIINLWEVNSGKRLAKLTQHKSSVTDLAFNSDDKLLLSGSSDGSLTLWDMQNYSPIQFWNEGEIYAIAFSPRDRKFVIATKNGIKYFDISFIIPQENIETPSRIMGSIAINHNGSQLLHGVKQKQQISLLDIKSNNSTIFTHDYPLINTPKVGFYSGNPFIFSNIGNHLYIWNSISKKRILKIPGTAISFHQKRVAIQDKNGLHIINFRGKQQYTYPRKQSNHMAILLREDKLLLSQDLMRVIHLDCKKQQETPLKIPIGNIISHSKKGKLLAIQKNTDLIIWNTKEQKAIATIDSFKESRTRVWSKYTNIETKTNVFHLQKKLFAAHSKNNYIDIWHLQTGTKITRLYAPFSKINYLVFSDDGNFLACAKQGSATVAMWKIGVHNPKRQMRIASWAKILFKGAKKTAISFDFRSDIAGEMIAKHLQKNPQKITEFLFELQTTPTLHEKNFAPTPRLWD